MAELKRVLSYKVLLLIVINSIMGTGIFFLPALGAQIAGPASIISWIIISIFAIYISMCFAELASMFPSAGGIYEFCKQAYGRVFSFFIGWLTLIVGNMTIAMLIIGAISYLLPPDVPVMKPAIIVISSIFILIFNIVAYRGMKISSTMLVTFSFITLGTIIALLIPGIFAFDLNNVTPFFRGENLTILLAVFFIAETFFGWESPTFLAGETKNGQKVVPKALVHGTIFICGISLLFVFFSVGAIGDAFGNSSVPFSTLASFLYGESGMSIFMVLVYLAIIGSAADWIVSAPRLVLSMARDKLFFPQFNKVHKKFNTPSRAIILQCFISIVFVFIGLGSYRTLLELLIPLLLVLYSLVILSVVVLRFKKPNLPRYYKVPFGKVGPIAVIVFLLSLLVVWAFLTDNAYIIIYRIFALILLGIPLYFLLEIYNDPATVRKTEDFLAYLTLAFEKVLLPMGIRKHILRLLGNIKGKTILEFGCSVGTLTMHLAEEVGPSGKVFATNFSRKAVDITRKRARSKGHSHVNVIQDSSHAYRVHPSVPKINLVISVGSLGYMQNAKGILQEMNKKMRVGNKICFVEYDKFFDIIPNVDWLASDTKIKSLFHQAGFRVSIIRKQGFAWKYIFIYGIKIKNL